MIKEEFYRKMIALYASSSNSERKQELINAMNKVLDENTDFDALYDTVLKEHQNYTMPTPAWLMSKKRNKNSSPVTNSITWTIWGETKSGEVYAFNCPMSAKVEEEKEKLPKYKPFPLTYVKDNKQEVKLQYGV